MTTEADSSTKDLAYYIDHPDELPVNDPALLERIMAEESGQSVQAQEPAGDKPKAGDDKGGEKKEEKPVVLSKDGKHVIPFETLEGEREARKQAERAAAEALREKERAAAEAQAANAQLGEILQKLKSTEARQAEEQLKTTAKVDPETRRVLEEQFPTLMTQFKALEADIELAKRTIADQQRVIEGIAAERRQDVAAEIDDMLAVEDPDMKDLNKWRSKTPYLWNRAIEVERELLKEDQKKWSKDEDRYKEVARRVRDEVGLAHPAALPQKTDPASEAERVIASAEQPPPNSLSDIHGGNRPASTATEEIGANVDTAVLGHRFMRMSQAERDAYLARLG